MKSHFFMAVLILLAVLPAQAVEIELAAGTELNVKTINRSEVQTGERSVVLLRPEVASSSLAQGVEPLPEYCVLSASMTLNGDRGLVIANHLLCVTPEKIIVEADVEGLVATNDGQTTVPVQCLQQAQNRCVKARLEPSNEFTFTIDDALTLIEQ